jgi:hypothetical protein
MLRVFLIAVAVVVAAVVSKRETYERMLATDLSGAAVTKDVAMAAIRKIHEREAVNVRNPNAKRLHNAAIDRMIADANAKFQRSPTVKF